MLSELEEKMRQSDKLLTHRQRESRELEDNVIVEEVCRVCVCACTLGYLLAQYVMFL